MIKKIWTSIEEVGKWNSLYAKKALKGYAHEGYCRHCGADILYYTSGMTSWPGMYEGKRCIDSGYQRLVDTCDQCGMLNNPLDKVYFDALAIEDGSVIEGFHLVAMQVFRKGEYEEYLQEYDKEGHVTFLIRKGQFNQ